MIPLLLITISILLTLAAIMACAYVGSLLLFSDNTELRETKEKLAAAEQKYRDLVTRIREDLK